MATTVARPGFMGQQAGLMFDSSANSGSGKRLPGRKEMTVLLAGLMALNAFAIDAMLPALPRMGADLNVAEPNDRQLVIIAYFIGFGATQLVWGPLADRFGRKPILAVGLALYAGFALLCAVAGSFTLLVAARALQGAAASTTRVLVVTMVRDLFEGEAMARIMSLVFMVFMVVPVLAPNIGQAILLIAPWRAIFLVLAAYGLVMLAWTALRLPETLHPEFRRSLQWREMGRAAWLTMKEPQSRGYTLALTITFGTLTAYIASIQQIVFDSFGAGELIGIVFAAIAAPMALASWLNSRIVGRYGLRRVGHGGALAFAVVSLVHLLTYELGYESLAVFIVLQALMMASFAFTTSNLGTLAMEHMAEIAGTASSVQGVVGTIGAAIIGFAIGQAFDGTPRPFLIGIAACACGTVLLIVLTEPKRLFAAIQTDRGEKVPDERQCVPEDLA